MLWGEHLNVQFKSQLCDWWQLQRDRAAGLEGSPGHQSEPFLAPKPPSDPWYKELEGFHPSYSSIPELLLTVHHITALGHRVPSLLKVQWTQVTAHLGLLHPADWSLCSTPPCTAFAVFLLGSTSLHPANDSNPNTTPALFQGSFHLLFTLFSDSVLGFAVSSASHQHLLRAPGPFLMAFMSSCTFK